MRATAKAEYWINREPLKLLGISLPSPRRFSAYGWIPIPVVCIKNGDGPRVLLMGGNHGDEYEGQSRSAS